MIDDKEPYNKIGRIIVKVLPQNWAKVVFHAEVQDVNINWSTECFFEGMDSGNPKAELLNSHPELLMALNDLRSMPIFPKVSCDIIYLSDNTYSIRFDKPTIEVKRLDIDEVRHTIRQLRALNLASVEMDLLTKYLGALMPGYELDSPIIPKHTMLYRGVEWNDKPHNITDLSYPPSHCVTSLHRAGMPGQSLFYCSMAREAPFFELRLVPETNVAISHWQTTDPIVVNNVGYHQDVFNTLTSQRDCPSWGKATDNVNHEDTTALLNSFFATEFARIVPPGQEYLYKLSIIIATLHFSDGIFGGLLYPALAMSANSDNLVLKPECVDKYLHIRKVEYFRVNKRDNQNFDVTIVDFANTFDEDGGIQWKGRHPHWVLREKGQVLHVMVENGRWVGRNDEGAIVEPE